VRGREGVLVTIGASERKLRRREREGEGVSAFETERVETEASFGSLEGNRMEWNE
jgi:hypothetical protein